MRPAVLAGVVSLAAVAPLVGQYPTGNINTSLRTDIDTVIILRVNGIEEPTESEIEQMVGYLNSLAQTNSYGHYWISCARQSNGKPFFNVSISGICPPFHLEHDAIRAFSAQYGSLPPLTAYDHVIMFYNPGSCTPSPVPTGVPRFLRYPTSFLPDSSQSNRMMKLAAAVFHEMGHGHDTNHAVDLTGWSYLGPPPTYKWNIPSGWPSASNKVDYGDPFDYMGGMVASSAKCGTNPLIQPCRRFFGTSSWYAAATDIHNNPIHKLQQGWLREQDILKVTASGTYTVRGLATDPWANPRSGVYTALEIDRGYETLSASPFTSAGATPKSLMIYYRNNEPLSDDGISIALVSRESMPPGTELIEFEEYAPPLPYGVLTPGTSFYDNASKATISVTLTGGDTHDASVGIVYDAGAPVSALGHSNLPLLNFTCPEIEGNAVIWTSAKPSSQTLLNVTVEATTVSGQAWQGINRVEVELAIVIGGTPVSSAVQTATQSGTTLQFDLASLIPHGPSTSNVGYGAIEARAFTNAGKTIDGHIKFLLDYRDYP